MTKKKKGASINRGFATTSTVIKVVPQLEVVDDDIILPEEKAVLIEEPLGSDGDNDDDPDRLIKLQIDLEFAKKIAERHPGPSISISSNFEYLLVQLARDRPKTLGKHSKSSSTIAYLTLERMGFTRMQTELILSKCMDHSMPRCLDWAVVHIDPQHLPPGLSDKVDHRYSKAETLTFVPRSSTIVERPKVSLVKTLSQPLPPQSSPKEESKSKQSIVEPFLKSWILSSLESDQLESEADASAIIPPLICSEKKEELESLDFINTLPPANAVALKLDKESIVKDTSELNNTEVLADGIIVEESDIFGSLFDESTAAVQHVHNTTKVRDMSYENWTGKSPKQYCMDYFARNAKGTQMKLCLINDDFPGFRCKVTLKDGPYNKLCVEMTKDERVVNAQQAQHYVATKLLLAVFPNLPIHRSLPNPYRELWLEHLKSQEKAAKDAIKSINQLRRDFIERLHESYQRNTSLTAKSEVSAPMQKERYNQTPFAKLASYHQERVGHAHYLKMLKARKKLPVYKFREEILESIKANRAVIISGTTGSGKSTQIPQFILEDSLSRNEECNILCTQPRRISTISLCERVGEELDPNLIGYQVRGDSKIGRDTRLVFMTCGILLRRLQSDLGLAGVTHVVVDEVHERSVDSDFLLLILKRIKLQNSTLKIVLMSATADSEKFSQYFDGVCIDIPGRTFPVNARFLEEALKETKYVIESGSEFALRRVFQSEQFNISVGRGKKSNQSVEWEEQSSVLERMDPKKIDLDLIELLCRHINHHGEVDIPGDKGAIIVFLPGYSEIKRLFERLSADARAQHLLVIPLHSMLGSGNQRDVFKPAPKGFRKVVLSTNIAETGITIPDATYVIDSCRSNQVGYDIHKHITRLSQVTIAKANCLQRRGRAGRVREVTCAEFEKLASHQTPEIMRVPLEELILQVTSSKLGPISAVLAEALDPPPPRHIERSLVELVKVQALDPMHNLTCLGSILVNFPVDVRLGKMLIYSVALGCLDNCLTIASALSLNKHPFHRPIGHEAEADKARSTYKRDDSDLLLIAYAYQDWRDACFRGDDRIFCESKYLSRTNLVMIEEMRGQLLRLLIQVGIVKRDVYDSQKNRGMISTMILDTYNKQSNNTIASLAALAAGLYPNVLKIVAEDIPERPSGLVLSSTYSSGFVFPHEKQSAYSMDIVPSSPRNSWYIYHMLSRVESKLRVWDLTRHRNGIVVLDNGVRVSCPSRSAVVLVNFCQLVFEELERLMLCKFDRTSSTSSTMNLFLELLREDLGLK